MANVIYDENSIKTLDYHEFDFTINSMYIIYIDKVCIW